MAEKSKRPWLNHRLLATVPVLTTVPARPSPIIPEPGRRARHKIFGEGTVVEVDREGGTCTIQFDGLPTPRSLALSAPLELL